MSNDTKEIKRIKDKKVFFVRVNEEIYKEIGVIADKDDRSINWTVNNILKRSLEDIKTK
jgi:hypothetical protein